MRAQGAATPYVVDDNRLGKRKNRSKKFTDI
jgi:hypothetical protein